VFSIQISVRKKCADILCIYRNAVNLSAYSEADCTMLNKDSTVQVSDTTMFNSIEKAKYIK